MKKFVLSSFFVMLIMALPWRSQSQVLAIKSDDFSTVSAAFQFVGSAAINGTKLRLTTSATNEFGCAWWKSRINLGATKAFSSFFSFQITNPSSTGADGIAYVIQTTSSGAGASGQGIGYQGITPSIAVEFDTYQNTGEPNGNHIAIVEDGAASSAHAAGTWVTAPYAMKNGSIYYIWVDYDGTVLEVRMSNSTTRPGAATLSKTVNLSTKFGASNNFVGLTSATGGEYATHDILRLLFSNTFISGGIDPNSTTYTQATSAVSVVANPSTIYIADKSIITATANYPNGSLASNVDVTFTTDGGGTFNTPTVKTNSSGVATDTFTGTTQGTFTITATAEGGATGNTGIQVDLPPSNITVTGTLNPFHTKVGTPSAFQTFTVSGDHLTANVIVTAPTDYEISKDSTIYSANLTLPQSGGTITGQPIKISVRITATAPIGTPSGNITLSSSGATTRNVAVTGIVNDTAILCGSRISINAPNFKGLQNSFQLNGNAIIDTTNNLLLTASSGGQAGSAFWKSKLHFPADYSFSTYFSVKISKNSTPTGADGIAFVIQDTTSTALSTGQGIGYGGISPSVVVEFDTYKNPFDPDGNHIAIIEDGLNDHSGGATSVDPPFDMKTVNLFHVWIEYNGTTKTLEVRASLTNIRPAAALTSKVIDIPAKFGASSIFTGFTGSTGSSYSQQEILSFLFDNKYSLSGIDPSCAYLSAPSSVTVTPIDNPILVNETSTIIVHTSFPDNSNASGIKVTLTNGLFATLSSLSGTTDNNGNVTLMATGVTGGNNKMTAIAEGGATGSGYLLVLENLINDNFITPNGDGHNDTWEVPHYDMFKDADVKIYDSYGQKLFSTTGWNDKWDGTHNGKALLTGEYYYLIKYSKGTLKGVILLMK